jgi:dipeptidase E
MTMNRLDARARLVFHYAREEADRLGHAVIESEHLLLGLLREGGTAAQVLNANGLTLEAARHRVVELIGRFERSRDAPPPAITALARRVMDLAGVEAANYQSSFINTGFVLLGMIHAGDGVAMGIINQSAGGTKAVRKATLAALNLPPEDTQDSEESTSNSSLSGIVAVPADSVLSRLFNRASEQVAPVPEALSEPPKAIIPETIEEITTKPEVITKNLEAVQPAIDQDDDIPDSMLIDEAFEEVPPEVELVTATSSLVELVNSEVKDTQEEPKVNDTQEEPLLESIVNEPILETKENLIAHISLEKTPISAINQSTLDSHEVNSMQNIENTDVATENIPESIVKVQTESQALATKLLVKNPTLESVELQVIEKQGKSTAEVMIKEAEPIPEEHLSKALQSSVFNNSNDDLLVSDLLETSVTQDTTLVSYQTPALVVLSEPAASPESNHALVVTKSNELESVEAISESLVEEVSSEQIVKEVSLVNMDSIPMIESDLQITQEPEFIAEQIVITEPQQLEESETEDAEKLELISQIDDETQSELETETQSELETETQSEFETETQNILKSETQTENNTQKPLVSSLVEVLPSTPPLLKVASWDMVTAASIVKRQIIALGGGGFSDESSNSLLDQYILEVASAAREVAVPRVCFVSTAAGDSDVYIKRFYNAFSQLNCQASHLPLFHTDDWSEDLEDMILSADVLYFSGGSTKNALALWDAWQLEPIFKQAYEAGTVFTGVSAGAICWFEQFTTDSMGRSLGVMNGLGWLPGSFTPHYDSERFRRPMLEKFLRAQKISPGFAADDHAAVHFINGEYTGAVASTTTAKAYHVTLGRNRLVESPLETRFLGEPT